MRKKLLFPLFLLILLFVAGCGGSGGGKTSVTNATLQGTVIDAATKKPLAGVKVTIGNATTTTTTQDGSFLTSTFPSGTYDVTFSTTGYATKSFSGAQIPGGAFKVQDNIAMQSGQAGEEPTVIKDVPLIGGAGEVTIAANGKVDTLVAIPYNISMNSGAYYSTVSVKADSQNLSIYPLTSRNTLSGNKLPDLSAPFRFRAQDFQTISAQGKLSAMNKNQSLRPNYSFNDDPNTTLKLKKSFNDKYVDFTATKVYKGSKCLIYVDSTKTMNQATIIDLANTFDQFYQTMVDYFGAPAGNLGDIDNNEMIYIVFSELYHSSAGTVMGYFDPKNEFPTTTFSTSSAKEMLFVTTYQPNGEKEWLADIKGTLAHEFQHLIFFNNRITKYSTEAELDSELWINEGLSMVAEDLAIAGIGNHNSSLDDRITLYLTDSTFNSLCTWENSVADYAPAYMFMRYFVDRIGENMIKPLVSGNGIGTQMLTNAAQSDFRSLFRDWLAAVYLSHVNYSLGDIYRYKTLKLATYSDFGVQTSGGIVMPDSTGGFIVQTGLSGKQQINVAINGNSEFNLRLLMIPAAGQSFSPTQALKLIRIN